MVRRFRVGLAAAVVLLAPGPTRLFGQWPAYPTAGVPKTADGKPDLTAPAPKTPDGKPDLSGVWLYMRPPAVPGTAPPPTAVPGVTSVPDVIPLAVRQSQFWNLGAAFKDGLPFQPWAAELHRQRVASNSKDNPDAHCLPLGLMQLHTHSQPRKMIQTPGVIVILYEANGGVRQIFTDGRSPPKNPEPWWFGYSAGKWDGDTLVWWKTVEEASAISAGWTWRAALSPTQAELWSASVASIMDTWKSKSLSTIRKPTPNLDCPGAPARSAGYRT